MASNPNVRTRVEATAGAGGGGTDIVCILAASATQADAMPRLFGSADAAFAMHGYSRGIEYASLHTEQTGKAFLFVALPIAAAGVVGRLDKTGHTGSSAVTVSAGSDGVLGEHDGVLRVKKGGTIGTDQIVLEYSLDGGIGFKSYRLGTAASMTIPYVDVDVAFGAGTLVAGDTIATWHGTDPQPDADGLADAFDNLAAQQKGFRSIMRIGDMTESTEAQAFLDKLNAYETSVDRFVYGRGSIADRLPIAAMSHDVARMAAGTSLTFAEVGSGIDTVTRATGSWIAEGFAVGDTVTFSGTGGTNDVTGVITVLTATVMTVSVDLADQVTAVAACVGYPTLTFAEVGAGGDTITRNRGSWVSDGFRAGDLITVDGTASNDSVVDAVVSTVTALVLTLGGGASAPEDLAAETISTNGVTVEAGQTKAEWMAAADSEFGAIDGPTARRLDLSAGRGKKLSPFSGWNFRFPCAWAASIREYQNDLHIPVWRKDAGNTGFDLFDTDQNLVEWDDRVDGGAGSAARFTTFWTWANGPGGAFIAQSLTRDSDGSILSYTHNMAVVNEICRVVQKMTENFVGRTPTLGEGGVATEDELKVLEKEVNDELERVILTSRGQGPRASFCVWSASRDDVLNVPEALLTGVTDVELNGTIHSVDTRVRVRSGG
jgi:hypothetical protein